MISRADRSFLAEWWRTIDKPLLSGVLILILLGFLLSFAASPPVAERIGLPPSHFTIRHAVFLVPSLILLIGLSFLDQRMVRRSALVLFIIAMALMMATLFIGEDVKGSRRWIWIAGFSLQPSEFMKPAFVILTAWLFAENSRQPEIPGNLFAIILFGMVAALLIAQPDFGQTVLVGIVWGAMFFVAGMSWLWIGGLGSLGALAFVGAYMFFPHVAGRIDRFITGEGDNFQVETAREAIITGGWLGQGPGEGTVKRYLPDSHTDFSFSVAAEEFGIIACILLVALFAFVVLRGLNRALREHNPFTRLAVSGLVIMFGMQSMINIMVNLQLMPAKGMTLPFISYGGSSLLSMSIVMGYVLALTRRRPDMYRNEPLSTTIKRFMPAE
ncbi:MAG: putative lipid II flippase FtsW [Nitratireductor sp.]|nr:putative lipid II flippase FtsW [Nitratireductor sp.]MCC0022329.1 putative lipid II flippase FtsW [Nitratireductor sp.]